LKLIARWLALKGEIQVLPRHCRLGKKVEALGIFLAPITLVAIKTKSS